MTLNSAESSGQSVPVYSIPVRVYYEDTDAAGIVYYANYLRFMERCRSDWLRKLGYDIGAIAEQFGILLAVRSCSVDYLKPARLSDSLTITASVQTLKRASLTLHQQVVRCGDVLCRGEVTLACLNTLTYKPVALPKPLVSDVKEWKMP